MDGDRQQARARAHAESLLELRRDAEAEQAFRDVLVGDPQSVAALLGLGRALSRLDRGAEAEAAVRRGLALAPDDPYGHHVLVDVLCARRDGAGALVAAEAGRALAPHDHTSHYQHARALLAQRRPRTREAYASALRAVDLAPHSPDAHNLVGLCLDRLGNPDAARTAFTNALAIDPGHTLAQNNLAATELDSGRLGRAAGLLRTAVGSNPQERRVRDNLDLVLLVLARRVLWSLVAAAVVLGGLLGAEQPWWTRALAGAVYVAVVALLVRRVRNQLPRGVARWSRGLWRRTGWAGRHLLALLVVATVGVLLLALAPQQVAVAAGAAMLLGMQLLLGLGVLGWLGYAVVGLVRGR